MEEKATKRSEGFFDISSGKCRVKGIAVKSGVSRNGIMYTGEELKKFAKTMAGVSIIKDHEAYVDNAVGVVELATFNSMDEAVPYDGWIKDEKLAEQIKDGRVKHVSIGAIVGRLVKEEEDSEYVIAKDMTCCELSTVVVPGVPGASIQQSIKDSKPIHESISGISKIKEAVKMEDKVKEPQVEEKVEDKLDTEISKMQELKKELMDEIKAMKEQHKGLVEQTISEVKKILTEQAEDEKPKEEEVKDEPKEEKVPVEDKTVGEVKTEATEEKSETEVKVERGDRGYSINQDTFTNEKLMRLRR